MESPLSNTPFDLRRGGRRVLRLSPKRWEGPGSGGRVFGESGNRGEDLVVRDNRERSLQGE